MACRVRLQVSNISNAKLSLISLNNHSGITAETRELWANHLIKTFNPNTNPSENIRSLDIILFPDGITKINHQPVTGNIDNKISSSEAWTDQAALYPAPYRIPPQTIADLDQKQRTLRAECFAFGSVLYEVFNNAPPLAGLSDEAIQERFSAAKFPKNVLDHPKWPIVLSCWSLEFAAELRQMSRALSPPPPSMLSRLKTYPAQHPYRFAMQTAGAVLSVAAIACPPLLAAVGFGTLGPVAGSGAAAWQASIGIVEAGSLFAWCQSAAMGGAALNGIIAAGLAGAGLVGAGVAGGLIEEDVGGVVAAQDEEGKLKAFEKFQELFKTGSDQVQEVVGE